MSSRGNSTRRTVIPQPTYDFLGGPGSNNGDNSPPRALRQTFRQSSRPPVANADNEELRAQLKSVRYEVEGLKQEKEVVRIRHEKELRDVQTRAEMDFKKAQTSESKGNVAASRYDILVREMQDLQDRSTNMQRDLERRLRASQDQGKELREETEEAQAELASSERQWSHRFQELEKKHDALQKTMREVKSDLDMKTSNLEATQTKLKSRESDLGFLEAEVLSLKASSGDADELVTIKNQLSDQVEHIRKLEIANREQTAELRNLRQAQRSAAIVEEEKRTLQLRLGKLDDVEKELDEAKYQRQLLEDERRAWASYLQSGIDGDQVTEFDSPEAMARALRDERIEKASLLERLGAAQPQMVEKEGLIQSLEEEKARLQTELAKLKSGSGTGTAGGSKAIARLERQKNLATKEIEYLREQLRTFDSEDLTGEVRTDAEEETNMRVNHLENLVSQYREELETAIAQLNSVEAPQQTSLKRSAPDSDNNDIASAQVGELSRKARKLQQELAVVQKERSTLVADNSALKTQLSALQASARTRVLSLRSNPTDNFESRKLSTIALLRRENAALHSQLEGRIGSRRKGDVVPAESLEEARLQTEEALAQVKSREKHNERLKQIFSAKSQEMREAIASLLGWNVEFLPNGKFRLTSIFANEGYHGSSKEIERHITFSGEKGTMTIAGGPDGEFGREIRSLIRFWVEERNEIPGFLAAYTLENLDRGREDD